MTVQQCISWSSQAGSASAGHSPPSLELPHHALAACHAGRQRRVQVAACLGLAAEGGAVTGVQGREAGAGGQSWGHGNEGEKRAIATTSEIAAGCNSSCCCPTWLAASLAIKHLSSSPHSPSRGAPAPPAPAGLRLSVVEPRFQLRHAVQLAPQWLHPIISTSSQQLPTRYLPAAQTQRAGWSEAWRGPAVRCRAGCRRQQQVRRPRL